MRVLQASSREDVLPPPPAARELGFSEGLTQGVTRGVHSLRQQGDVMLFGGGGDGHSITLQRLRSRLAAGESPDTIQDT